MSAKMAANGIDKSRLFNEKHFFEVYKEKNLLQ